MIEQTASGAIVATGNGVTVYRILALRASLNLFAAGMKHSRMTQTQALRCASSYTGKAYPNSKAGIATARDDLKAKADDLAKVAA